MTPSNLALTLDVANQKIDAGEPLNCEELDALNQDARSKEVTQAHQSKPLTLTTSSGTGGFEKASSTQGAITTKAVDQNEKVSRQSRDGYASTNSKDTMSCSEESAGGNQNRNHTEPKLIEPKVKKGGKITMKIHHQFWAKSDDGRIIEPRELKSDAMPCDQCKKAICKAGTCKPPIVIMLCNNNNKPVKPACNADGTPKESKHWEAKGLGLHKK